MSGRNHRLGRVLTGLSLAGLLTVMISLTASADPGSTSTIEVSQPVQVTSNGYYERGQSIVYDGSDYWLFYGRSASVTGNYGSGDPDTHDYVVYYKKASTIAGLAAASATQVTGTHNVNVYLGETDAAYFGGEVWVFASHDAGTNADLYAWRTTDGSSWTETSVVTGLPDGAAHFAAASSNGNLWLAYQMGNDWNSKYYDGSSWSSEFDITENYGTGKLYAEGTNLYFVRADSGDQDIHEWGGSAWSQIDSATESGPYDPTIYKVGSNYVCAYAPWVSPKQWIKAKVGTSLNTVLSSGKEVVITGAEYGSNTWIDMWPTGFTDSGGDTYLLYTSERNPNDPSSEIDGNIWYLEVDWDVTLDHYTYIQEAIDAATAGDTINVASGTYNEHITIDNSLTLQGAGASQTTIDVSGLPTQNPHIAVEIQNGVNDVSIDGFSITAKPDPHYSDDSVIRCGGSSGTNNNITISNNVLEGYKGVLFKNGDSLAVQNNDITFNKNAVVVQSGCTNVDISGNSMTKGTNIDTDPYAIYATSTTGSITGNTIQDVIGSTDSRGKGIGGSSNYDLLIDGNVIDNTGYDGISFWSNTHHITITNNTLSNNAQTYTKGAGITIKGDDITIKNNTITGSGHDGIIIDVHTLPTERVHIIHNDLSGNTGYGLRVVDAAETVDASANWWGSADPVTAGGMVTGTLDFTPLLETGGDTLPGTDGFQPDLSSLTVHTLGEQTGTSGRIQEGIDLVYGSTVNLAAGTYDGTINVEGRTGLTINGADKNTVVIKLSDAADLLCWDVGGYGCGRKSVVRLVDATGFSLQNLTLDGASISGNHVFLISGWDSTGTVHNNILKNMSRSDADGYYYELGTYFRGAGFTPAARGELLITDNTFIDAGRVGVVTHDYLDSSITGNTFYKTIDDFGYAVEMGSQSIGEIKNNTIYGYDLPAASDGSESAGIYIENAFTNGVTSAIAKDVVVDNNEVYDCQYGMWIGNGYDGYAGNVDISVTLTNNSFHDNLDGAAWIQDEDKEHGSSVTVTGSGNSLDSNGDYGYYVYSDGDGDITVDLTGETITNHTVGVYLTDTVPATTGSTYDITVGGSSITGNGSYGVKNDYAGTIIDATNNWWGAASGPGPVGPGTGDNVSTFVDYSPWWGDAAGTFTVQENAAGEIVIPSGTSAAEIQAIIDDAPSGAVIVLPPETIPVSGGFTLSSPGVTIRFSNGTIVQATSPCFTVTADNTTIESSDLGGVCQPSGSSPGIDVSTDVTGLVIKGIEIDGANTTGDGVLITASVQDLQILDSYIHDCDNGIEYASTASVSGVHEIQGNLFQNNSGDGINDQTASGFNVEYNAWGDILGPNSGSGDGATASLDYAPWTHVALSMISSGSPQADEVAEGYQITYTVQIDAEQVYGADFDLAFDDAKLEVTAISNSGAFQQQGECKISTPTEANSSGEISFCGNRTTALSGQAQDVFVVTFQALAGAGGSTVQLNLDETDDAFSMKPGYGSSNTIYASALDDGTLTIYDATTVSGRIDLEGRADDTGANMTFGTGTDRGYGPYTFSTSDYWGSISASGVTYQDTYAITVDMDRYLNVTITSSKSATITGDDQSLSTLVLLGGDANDDDTIDVSDATIIGGEYGKSGTGITDQRADINDDDTVDIYDLVLMGGNYGKSSDTAYDSWSP